MTGTGKLCLLVPALALMLLAVGAPGVEAWGIVCPSRWCFDVCGNEMDICIGVCEGVGGEEDVECDTDCFMEYLRCTDGCGPDVCFVIP